MRIKIIEILFVCFIGFTLVQITGCTDKYEPVGTDFTASQESSCKVCHLDQELLKQVADPIETGGEDSGEG